MQFSRWEYIWYLIEKKSYMSFIENKCFTAERLRYGCLRRKQPLNKSKENVICRIYILWKGQSMVCNFIKKGRVYFQNHFDSLSTFSIIFLVRETLDCLSYFPTLNKDKEISNYSFFQAPLVKKFNAFPAILILKHSALWYQMDKVSWDYGWDSNLFLS